MESDLGFDPMPSKKVTWEQYYKMSRWFNDNAKEVAYGTGHQAKQFTALTDDFSNVLWAYGGDFFENGARVGRLGAVDPGPSTLDKPEAIQAATFYKKLMDIAHPGSTSWDWNDLGEAFGAGEFAMAPCWHEFAGAWWIPGGLESKSVTHRFPRDRPGAPTITVERASGSISGPPKTNRKRPGCSSCGPPPPKRSSWTSRAALEAGHRPGTPSTSYIRSRKTETSNGDAEHIDGPRRAQGVGTPEHRTPSQDPSPGTSATPLFTPSSHRCWRVPRAPRRRCATRSAAWIRRRKESRVQSEAVKSSGGERSGTLDLVVRGPDDASSAGDPRRHLDPAPFVHNLDEPQQRYAARRRRHKSKWVGLGNWGRMFSDGTVWAGWLAMVIYFVATVGLEMILGIAIALVDPRGRLGQEPGALAHSDPDVHGARHRGPARPVHGQLDLRALLLGTQRAAASSTGNILGGRCRRSLPWS